jgi:hypothetical protein
MLLSIRKVLTVGCAVFPLSYHLRRGGGEKIIPASAASSLAHGIIPLLTGQSAARKTTRIRLRKDVRSTASAHRPGQDSASVLGAWANSPRYALSLATVIFALHVLGLLLIFQPVRGLFDRNPLIDQDWGLHFHHLQSIEAFWSNARSVSGYNPLFMAGYPSNTIQDLSIKFFEFAALGLSALALSPIQWFKLTAFIAMAEVPWIMYFAAQNFFFTDDSRQGAALAATLLGTIYWWNSLPREMYFYGMIGFPVASYLSVWGASLFYRIACDGRAFTPAHFGWLVFALVILPLHVQSILTFLPPLAALLIIQPKLLQRNLLLVVVGAAALSLLVNLPWILPAFAHRGDDISNAMVDQLPLFASAHPFTFFIDYLGTTGFWTFRSGFFEKGFRLMLLVLGTLGIWLLLNNHKRRLGIMLACGVMVMFLVTYFGSFIPSIKAWQPLRFKVPYDLFLTIGAAYTVSQWTARRAAATFRYVPWLVGVAICAFILNLWRTESFGKLHLRATMNREMNGIVEWIYRETPPRGRVLFEESGDETGFVYDGMYLSAFLPHWTGRQLIGGPINLYNDRHHFAEFHSGKLFKRDIQTLSDEELRNYLRLYNIGAVVAYHPASLKRLESLAGLVSFDRRIGPAHLLKVNQSLSWFLEGDGEVEAGLGRLQVRNVTGREIILKYHWVEGLRGVPAVKMVPVKQGDDPIPFIKVIDPPANFALQIGE